ncbi:hypothetical protein IRZ53_17535 [Pseudomonas fulva]|uniref:hypothetical protein n=1 Tax=Pseudomonas fulva TaxID=47880 RepID=UPI0018A93097|nr:hypothetical protein [Pseudomonas fulva]MBF8676198.1 hypothetical protein [Pseudomonas fulva]MBF8698586.1 hypothetical protein [Pseudomonas fulva]
MNIYRQKIEEIRQEFMESIRAQEQEILALQAENEALRTGQAIKRLSSDEVREAFNGAYYQSRDTGSDGEQCRAGVLAVIEAAMAKEARHD